jgi:hypothetical protein
VFDGLFIPYSYFILLLTFLKNYVNVTINYRNSIVELGVHHGPNVAFNCKKYYKKEDSIVTKVISYSFQCSRRIVVALTTTFTINTTKFVVAVAIRTLNSAPCSRYPPQFYKGQRTTLLTLS